MSDFHSNDSYNIHKPSDALCAPHSDCLSRHSSLDSLSLYRTVSFMLPVGVWLFYWFGPVTWSVLLVCFYLAGSSGEDVSGNMVGKSKFIPKILEIVSMTVSVLNKLFACFLQSVKVSDELTKYPCQRQTDTLIDRLQLQDKLQQKFSPEDFLQIMSHLRNIWLTCLSAGWWC